MAGRPGLRKFHGSRVGEMATAVYVCDRCRCWQTDLRGRPLSKPEFFCIDPKCGGTQFMRFDSQAEAKTIASLWLRVDRGLIADLELQPRYPLHVPTSYGGMALLWTYVADARYRDKETGEIVVVDVKGGADTHISAAKRKHCEAEYGIKIRIMQPD